VPLRCLDPGTGREIHAFDLSRDEWRTLARENRATRHLRMPCCSAEITLKTSQHGTQFFAHRAIGNCTTAPETEAHLRLKQMAVAAARANGWNATTEMSGSTADGERWKADVLAEKAGQKVAVEIQWSGQTNEESLSRQRRYTSSGIRGLWLLRRSGFPITRDLPAARIFENADRSLAALIPTGSGEQSVPMEEFLHAAFSRRLKFGMPEGFAATVSIGASYTDCWRSSCQARTRIITYVVVTYGPYECQFTIPKLGEYPELFPIIRNHLPNDPEIGEIKHRYSKTQERSYLSNGCVRCDALIGEWYEIFSRHREQTVCEFVIPASKPWLHAIKAESGGQEGWGVYRLP
jgi:hypothetical protein